MQAVEFQTTIVDGMVQIPKKYKALQHTSNATVIVMYQDTPKEDTNQNVLQELDTLFANSDNKVMLTMDIATDTSGMMDDGLF